MFRDVMLCLCLLLYAIICYVMLKYVIEQYDLVWHGME